MGRQEFVQTVVDKGVELDVFIGERSFTGQGLGSKIIEAFLESVVWKDFEFCVADPDVRNIYSIKMFEKCGFKKHKTIKSNDALGKPVKLVLMVRKRYD